MNKVESWPVFWRMEERHDGVSITRINVPVLVVGSLLVSAVTTAVSVMFAVFVTTANMRSDIRDMNTRMEALTKTVDTLTREQRMQQEYTRAIENKLAEALARRD